MANARTPTPIWGAASPTHAGDARIVSIRSTASARAASSMRPTGAATCFSTGSGSRTTGRTVTWLQDVGFGGVGGAVDADVGGESPEPAGEIVAVDAGR